MRSLFTTLFPSCQRIFSILYKPFFNCEVIHHYHYFYFCFFILHWRYLYFWPSEKRNRSPTGVCLWAAASVYWKFTSSSVVCVSVSPGEVEMQIKEQRSWLLDHSDSHKVSIVKRSDLPGVSLLWRNCQYFSLILSTNEHICMRE